MVMNPAGFIFSDGIHLPSENFITATATYATHHDDTRRCHLMGSVSRLRARTGGEGWAESTKFRMVMPDAAFLSLGLGKHGVLGCVFLPLFLLPTCCDYSTNNRRVEQRFFAVTELKLMLTHIQNYDVRLEQEGVHPLRKWFRTTCRENRSAKILFKKRTEFFVGG
jgi:hypothetical protein